MHSQQPPETITLQLRNLPANLDAERFILGACLTDPDALPLSMELLNTEDFSESRHALAFQHMLRLFEKGTSVDRVTVSNSLRSEMDAEVISFVTSLDEGMPKLYNLDSYIDIVRRKAVLRRTILASAELIQQCQIATDDADELANKAEQILNLVQDDQSKRDMPKTVGEIVIESGSVNAFLSPESVAAIPIPFRNLNATLDGLRPGKLILFGARPGIGKTALMQQCAESTAAQGFRSLVISKEMTDKDLIHRSVCGRANVSAYSFRKGKLNPQQRRELQGELNKMVQLDDLLLIYDNENCTVQKIGYMLRRLKSLGKPVQVCYIDYAQILDVVGRFENNVQQISAISKGLVKLKKEFNIPFVVLVQVNREGEATASKDDEPKAKHIAEADRLVRDADTILLMWVHAKEEEKDAMNPTRSELIVNWKVPKNRDGMKNRGGVDSKGENRNGLTFIKSRVRFAEDLDVFQQEVAA
jgi:replicative DNA helicase